MLLPHDAVKNEDIVHSIKFCMRPPTYDKIKPCQDKEYLDRKTREAIAEDKVFQDKLPSQDADTSCFCLTGLDNINPEDIDEEELKKILGDALGIPPENVIISDIEKLPDGSIFVKFKHPKDASAKSPFDT
eukprot:UN16246